MSPKPAEIPPLQETLGTPPRTFQDLIFALQKYWANQGCVILQPYDMEMGAGTFHTATFLRSIGPEPWSAQYFCSAKIRSWKVRGGVPNSCWMGDFSAGVDGMIWLVLAGAKYSRGLRWWPYRFMARISYTCEMAAPSHA